MTAKAGQKCTAIRRIIVPEALIGPVGEAIAAKLATIRIGDPALETTRMGALASAAQKSRRARQGKPDRRRMPPALWQSGDLRGRRRRQGQGGLRRPDAVCLRRSRCG
jgi:acyl-CoA reductase-like NAD-dependent aldehyde dehydrogenase